MRNFPDARATVRALASVIAILALAGCAPMRGGVGPGPGPHHGPGGGWAEPGGGGWHHGERWGDGEPPCAYAQDCGQWIGSSRE